MSPDREPTTVLAYDRAVLVDVVIYHWRRGIEGCGCGWADLGASYAAHIADVYEQSVAAKAGVARDVG